MRVILDGDQALGYNDYDGIEVIGVMQATIGTRRSEGKAICVTGDMAHFPYHKIGIGTYGTLDIPVTGTGKMRIGGKNVILNGTIISNGAHLVASGTKLNS